MNKKELARIKNELKKAYVSRGWPYPNCRDRITEDFLFDFSDLLDANGYSEHEDRIISKMFGTHSAMAYGPEKFYKEWEDFSNWVAENYFPEFE